MRIKKLLVPVLFLLAIQVFPVFMEVNQGEADPVYSPVDVMILVVFVLLALVFSFLCSVAEAVLLSITPSYIEGLRQEQPERAAMLKRFRQDNVDRSLAAILTLNTIAHTVGAVGAGAQASVVFGNAWLGLFSAAMTLMILFLSEIIPKTLGAVFWKQLTRATMLFLRGLIVVLHPLIVLTEGVTKLIARGKTMHVFSRKEFLAMATVGEKSGDINQKESRIIRNLFRFDSLRARDIMTPRTVIVALQKDMTVSQALDCCSDTPFSRLPLYGNGFDDISGFVLKNDLLMAKIQDRGEEKLHILRRELKSVIELLPLTQLLDFLFDQRQHIALVVDEYGGTEGLVTLEDLVETLLGMEIVDEADKTEDMQAMARQLWKKRAGALGLHVRVGKEANK